MIRVVGCEVRKVERELAFAVGGGSHRTQRRFALEISVRDHEGRIGRGEASPLPGYSLDSIEEAAAHLARVGAGEYPLQEVDAPPAVRFALECALFDLAAQAAGRPLWSLLRESDDAPILALSAMLVGPDDDLANEAALRRGEGYALVKRKLSEDLAALQAIPRPLRLDGNRAYTVAQLREHARTLDALQPDLIEEPGPLREAADILSSPLAADESIAARTTKDSLVQLDALGPLIQRGRMRAIVIKPAREGLLGALQLGRRARELGAQVIVTHLWDGPIGHLAAAHVALALGAVHSPAQGLAPHPGLGAERFSSLVVGGALVPPRGAGLSDA